MTTRRTNSEIEERQRTGEGRRTRHEDQNQYDNRNYSVGGVRIQHQLFEDPRGSSRNVGRHADGSGYGRGTGNDENLLERQPPRRRDRHEDRGETEEERADRKGHDRSKWPLRKPLPEHGAAPRSTAMQQEPYQGGQRTSWNDTRYKQERNQQDPRRTTSLREDDRQRSGSERSDNQGQKDQDSNSSNQDKGE